MTPSTLMELAGLASLIVAFFLIATPLGLIALGASLLLIGVAMEGREE